MHTIETLRQTITLDNSTLQAVREYIEDLDTAPPPEPAPVSPAPVSPAPGPWTVAGPVGAPVSSVPCAGLYVHSSDHRTVAHVWGTTPAEVLANARLAASAPKLLKALEIRIDRHQRQLREGGLAWSYYRAAIAEATGGEGGTQ